MPARPRVADATGGLARRRRRSRRAFWIRLAVGVVAAALLGAGIWLLWFSAVLSVQRVLVTGTDALSGSDVTAAAQVQLGRPLARQDIESIAERVAALRAVESVQVSRDWPQSVRIAVVERTPVLAVRTPSGYSLVDAAGVSFRTVDSVPARVAVAEVSPGDGALLKQVGEVIEALPASLGGSVASIQAESADSIILVLRNADRIVWGSAEQSAIKAQVLVPLMKHQASVYDVSAPGNPARR